MICAELQERDADIYCISVSWITSPDDLTLYSFRDYLSFCNCRPDRSRCGVMLLINPKLQPVLCKQSSLMSTSKYYNICSVKLMNCSPVTTLVVVYRPPDTPVLDTADMLQDLNITLISSRFSIVVGDFNIQRN